MRVLLVNDYVRAGGCEVHVDLIRAGLLARGHTVALFTAKDVANHRRTALSYIHDRRARAALRTTLEQFAPDVIHLHNFYHELSPAILGAVADWKRRSGGRAIMTAHDLHVVCPNAGGRYYAGQSPVVADHDDVRRPGRLLRRRWDHRGMGYSTLRLLQHVWNYRLLRRQSVLDLVICPSRYLQARLDAWGLNTTHVVHAAPAPCSHDRRSQTGLRAVLAGRVEPEKGIVEFLEQLPESLDLHITIVGDGSALEACRRVVAGRGLGDRVAFTGRLPHAGVRQHIARAHVLVLPSRVPEASGLVLLEAIACGTSVLTTCLGGAPEIVEDTGVGEIFDPFDPRSLPDALARVARRYAAGDLNSFDSARSLDGYGEDRFFHRLTACYDGL